MVAAAVSKPDVQVVHIGCGGCVVGNGGGHSGAHLGVGHTQVRVQGNAPVPQTPDTLDLSKALPLLVGQKGIVVALPAVGGGKTEGLGGPAVTHVVEHQAALGDLRLALPLPLEHL